MQDSFFNPMVAAPCIPPLRDYQATAFDELRDGLRQGILSQMLSSPTGSGKSLLAASLMEAALVKGSRAWLIADREMLVEQLSDALRGFGLPHGIIMAERSRDRHLPLQVCSAQSVTARLARGSLVLPDLAANDEGHIIYAALMRRLLRGKVPTVGFSASPVTPGLGRWYKRVVVTKSTNELLAEGWLAPLRIMVPDHVVESRFMDTNKSGEFTDASAGRAAMRITGDIVADWATFTAHHFPTRRPKTLVFAATIPHAEHLTRAFADKGVDMRLYIQNTPKDERKRALAALEAGGCDGLISCDALTRGFDQADIECIVMARAYKRSLSQVIQMLGRGMRTADGKEYCLVLDAAGNFLRMWEDIFEFWARGAPETLDMGARPVVNMRERKRGEIECRECGIVRPPGNKLCPNCGAQPRARELDVEAVAGTLTEFDPSAFEASDRDSQKTREEIDREALETPWPHICAMAIRRLRLGFYKDKPDPYQAAVSWARVQFKELKGKWAPRTWDDLSPGEKTRANPAVVRAVNERIDAWKKAQQQEETASDERTEEPRERPGIDLFAA